MQSCPILEKNWFCIADYIIQRIVFGAIQVRGHIDTSTSMRRQLFVGVCTNLKAT